MPPSAGLLVTGVTRTCWAGGRVLGSYFKMLIARAITSPKTPSDTIASTVMSSLAHRLTAEMSVGLKAVAVQKASDR
jgi:hypothetical protein